MMNRAEKETIIANLKTDLENAKGIFLTNLIGLSSNDAVALRKGVRDVDGKIVITRNTLFNRAAQGTTAEKMLAGLKGPHAVALAFEDSAAVAKCLKKAGKEHEGIVDLKGGLLNGEELSLAQVMELADLPSRDEMLGTLLATFNAPISALARVMNSVREKAEEQGVETMGAISAEGSAAEAAAPTEAEAPKEEVPAEPAE